MSTASDAKVRGATSYYAGIAAEEAVARAYCDRGYRVISQRWRGKGGEIDLIVGACAARVFVEVKKSKTFDRAAYRISPRQAHRLFAAAEEFLGAEPSGLLTEARFDVALVDQYGGIEIMENALVTG